MAKVSYHDTVNDLQGLSFTGPGPFARVEWFELVERFGVKPLIICAQDDDQAVALAFTRRNASLVPLTNWYAFTWQELVTEGADRGKLLHTLADALGNIASHVVLEKLPDDDGTTARLEAAFRSAGWLTHRQICDRNHIIRLTGSNYAAYLAARPGPLRTTLARKAKRVSVEIVTRFERDAWESYESVYRESWKPEEGAPQLLRRFAEQEGAADRLRLGLARNAGEVVAAQFWTVDHGTAYIHKLAHRENAARLSAGTTLTAALFEQVIDRDRVKLVDFGTGDDAYKRDWMDEERPRYRLDCWRPESPRNWPAIGKTLLRNLVSRCRAG